MEHKRLTTQWHRDVNLFFVLSADFASTNLVNWFLFFFYYVWQSAHQELSLSLYRSHQRDFPVGRKQYSNILRFRK